MENFLSIGINALIFVIPGFITSIIIRLNTPQTKKTDTVNLIYYVMYSALNYILWIWFIVDRANVDYISAKPLESTLMILLIMFISPTVLAISLLLIKNIVDLEKIGKIFKFNVDLGKPTAWDYKFSKIGSEGRLVIVVLEDGTEIRGFWAGKSFAADDCDERDIYIQEVYNVNEEGTWNKADKTDGILVIKDKIKLIEFFHN